jgi:antitoxin ParD1/3/4
LQRVLRGSKQWICSIKIFISVHTFEVSNDLALAVPKLAHLFNRAYLEDRIAEAKMTQTTTMTVRISGALSEFVASNVGENGAYENISEYVRDLIRRDKERAEREAELTRAFAAPEDNFHPLTAAEVIARNRG